eukprot:5263833-Lingulodinium_polyedra.AAC.1
MEGGPAKYGMRLGKSSSRAGRPSGFSCGGCPALRAGMAAQPGAVRGGPFARPLSCGAWRMP